MRRTLLIAKLFLLDTSSLFAIVSLYLTPWLFLRPTQKLVT